MALDKLNDYFKHLDNSVFNAISCQDAAPSEERIKNFEHKIGFTLPEEFREFSMSRLGGMYIEVKKELWPRNDAPGAIGPFWTFLYAIKVFGFSEEAPEWLDLEIQYREFEEENNTSGLVPFMQLEGDSDMYCFTSDKKIVKWSHEEPENLYTIDHSFSEVFLEEISELEKRKNRMLKQVD